MLHSRLAQFFLIFVAMTSLVGALSALTVAEITDAVTKVDEPPAPVRTVAPKYPDQLKQDGVSGVVTVTMVLNEKGEVLAAEVVKTTHDAFSEPALDAIRRWRFKPGKNGGVAVKVKVTIPLRFNAE
jgi:periplasmic protein TonB